MTTIDELVAIREIEVLKAGYCRTIDRKDWAGLRELFTPHAQLHSGANTFTGRDAIVAIISTTIGDALTAHCAHTPVITLTSATTATGNWGAIYTRAGGPVGYGEYDERYLRGDDGPWLIAETRLTTLFQ
jgi:hypothetical protein